MSFWLLIILIFKIKDVCFNYDVKKRQKKKKEKYEINLVSLNIFFFDKLFPKSTQLYVCFSIITYASTYEYQYK